MVKESAQGLAQEQGDISSFKKALEHFQQKEYDLAISLLEAYNEHNPHHFDSVHILGACYASKTEYPKAFEYFELAFKIDPNNLMLNLNMAKSYAMSKQFDSACKQAENCLRIDSGNEEAKKVLSDATARKRANNADYRKAIELYDSDKADLARPLFEKHLEDFPKDFMCMEYLGIIHCGDKDYDLGMYYFYSALSHKPSRYSIHYNIASAFYHQKEYDKAFGSVHLCLSYNSKYKEGLYLLSKVYQERKDLPLAASTLRKYLEISSADGTDDGLVVSDLVYHNLHLLRWEEIARDFGELLKGDYAKVKAFPALLLLDDLELLKKISVSHSVNQSSEFPLVVGDSFKKDRRSGDKIKVGYISSDVGHHPAFYISSHLFKEHNRDDFEIYLYSTAIFEESADVIKFAKGASDHYRDLSETTSKEAYDIVRGDDLDILVDLIGYTGGKGNRRSLLAMRLAPVLINYLGYMGSMGSPYHDYIIGDEYVIPRGSAQHYTEEVLYVDCVFAYDRSILLGHKAVKERSDFGLPDGIILGAFNQPVKVTESIFSCWMRILESCPDSYLWVSFRLECSRSAFVERARDRGISEDRLIMSDAARAFDHLRRYEFCDLCLDTYPYNGGMTSLDALHGGCPIVTLPGETMMSRVTASLLEHIDLGELVSDSFDDYVEKAVSLIRDGERLRSLRKHIGDRLSGSAIYDSERMTRQLEDHYRSIVSKGSVKS